MNTTYLGIDFGTTKTLVSRFNESENKAVTVHLGRGTDFVPTSVLVVGIDSFSFGDDADDFSVYQPESYVRAFKRFLGQNDYLVMYQDEKTRKPYTAADLTQKYLEYILQECERNSYKCDRAVLTRPVKFTPARLKQLKKAALDAGLREVEFITEPEAAGYAYCKEHPDDTWENALVVDWGGGTLDMALVSKKGKEVVAHEQYRDGMPNGGEDFDDKLHLLAEVLINHGKDERTFNADKDDKGWLRGMRKQIIRAKENLSRNDHHDLRLRSCKGKAYKPMQLTRKAFVEGIESYLDQAAKMAKNLIDKIATKDKSLIPTVILLVGGSCKIPAVADAIHEATGIDKENIKTWEKSDQAVSLGAAIYAKHKWGNSEALPVAVSKDRDGKTFERLWASFVEEVQKTVQEKIKKAKDKLIKKIKNIPSKDVFRAEVSRDEVVLKELNNEFARDVMKLVRELYELSIKKQIEFISESPALAEQIVPAFNGATEGLGKFEEKDFCIFNIISLPEIILDERPPLDILTWLLLKGGTWIFRKAIRGSRVEDFMIRNRKKKLSGEKDEILRELLSCVDQESKKVEEKIMAKFSSRVDV